MMHKKKITVLLLPGLLLFSFMHFSRTENKEFIGISGLTWSSSHNYLYITQYEGKRIDAFNLNNNHISGSIKLDDKPNKTIISNDDKLLVLQGENNGRLLIFNLKKLRKEREIQVGHSPVALHETESHFIVCNRFPGLITFIHKKDFKTEKIINVGREPVAMTGIPGSDMLYIAHHLPEMPSTDEHVASKVSILDTKKQKIIKTILLPNGSNGLKDISASKDGKFVVITHILARYHLPTTMLERGWMNTNAISIIDTENADLWATILLDDIDLGAANPWAIAFSEEGKTLFVSHAGTHEVSMIDWERMKEAILDSRSDTKEFELTENLSFIYPFRKRIALQGNGPRAIVTTGNLLISGNYFSSNLSIINLDNLKEKIFQLANPDLSNIQRGERYFNDANLCFQKWQSCASCHPDARVDGLNWDLLNDGIGNPKNTKSLLYSHVTPPAMISGVRATAELAVRRGFTHIQFAEISEDNALSVDKYLKSLRPVPSPYLIDGKLSEKAERGKKVFEKLGCGACHSGQYYTDLNMYRIGKDIEFEKGWDTPTLIEVWRTTPYLFDGRAAKMKDVYPVHKHGIGKKVSEKEIEELVEYVNSL